MTKKNYKPKYLSAITKNLNWQILTKNLVTFKRQDGVKYQKCKYYGGSPIVRAGVTKKQLYMGNCLKRGLGQFAEGLAKNREVVFEAGLIPRCKI